MLNARLFSTLNPRISSNAIFYKSNYDRRKQNKNSCFQCASLQIRHFSLQSTIDSLIKTQVGFFKSLSESTPVEYFQKFLLTVHDSTGLPWWATIVCTTIALRTCITLPLSIYQNYILAKYENLHLEMPDIVKELKYETAVAVKMFNWDERTARMHYNRSVSYIDFVSLFICVFILFLHF